MASFGYSGSRGTHQRPELEISTLKDQSTSTLHRVIEMDARKLDDHLGQIVRGTVEDTLNALLEAEADTLCGAGRYQRSPERRDPRAGSYHRKLETNAGEMTLKVPTLRTLPFESAISERYRRREASVEEALIEMYLAGVSVRRVEEVTEALWGTRVSSGTVSTLHQTIDKPIEAWRNRGIEGEYPYVFLDGMVLKRTWAGEVRNVSVLVAIGGGADGYRMVLGLAEGAKEDQAGWLAFLKHLKDRGLVGAQLFISDACMGLIDAIGECYPEARWQREVAQM